MQRTPGLKECVEAMRVCPTQAEAARMLGVSRHTLYRILRRTRPEEEKLTRLEEHSLKKQNQALRRDLTAALEDAERSKRLADVVAKALDPDTHNLGKVPDWVASKTPKGVDSEAVSAFMLSDLHFGEVINPAAIDGLNAYNMTIGEMRIGKFFDNAIRLHRDFFPNLDFRGMVQFWLGDFISGDIHEELAKTNEKETIETVLILSGLLSHGLRKMLNELDGTPVHIAAVVGNHGRTTKKPAHKNKVTSSFDWLVYKMVQREFVGDDRVTFAISEGSDIRVRVLNTTFLATHGDQFKGGSGISAQVFPLLLGDYRKRKRSISTGTPYDWMLCGHFHRYLPGVSGVMANGSVCGYNEFAASHNFDYEPPLQSFFVVDSDHGVTFRTGIHLESPEEGWRTPKEVDFFSGK